MVVALLGILPVTAGAGLPEMPEPLGNVVLSEKPADAHWVWLGDFQSGLYSRSILYNADTGDMLGMIDTGWEGIKLDLPRSGDEIYNLAMYMSRGYRGVRTDAITAYDRKTLHPLRELVVPAKGIHGWPDVNHTALSDDDRFLWMQFFTPASSIGVADVKENSYRGEIETTGCAHVMAAGPRRFFSLCGDGSVLAVDVDDVGAEVGRKRFPGFFDPDKDPLHGSGTRVGDTWYFVSHRGEVHAVDVSGGDFKFAAPWRVSETIDALTWVPGPLMQTVAVHRASNRLFVLMHPSTLEPKGGGYDFHREDAAEVWVFDLVTHRRLSRVALRHPGSGVAVSQDATPLLYVAALKHGAVTVYDAGSGQPKRDIVIATFPTVIQPVD